MARRSRSPSNLRPRNDGVASDAPPHLGVAHSTVITDAAAQWQVNYNGGALHEIVTFSNAASIHASDFAFI
jgi:hypothetical protein